jgi:hypothetical protein
MRRGWVGLCLGAGLLLAPASVLGAENGLMIRAGDLMSEPFIDSQKSAKVKAKQKVTILERKGGWIRVETNGQAGWVRSLNVRLEEGAGRPRGSSGNVAQLRTGSSGRTATTGVKGLDDEDIAKASANYGELAALDATAVPQADAKSAAAQKQLSENQVAYLAEGDD